MALAPFRRDFVSLRDAINELMQDSMVLPEGILDGRDKPFTVDLRETPEAYELTAALPGVKPDDLDISATAESVTIKGKYASETEAQEGSYLRHERRSGSFERSFGLSVPIDPERVVATQANGVLTLALPKTEKTKPKKVQIKAT